MISFSEILIILNTIYCVLMVSWMVLVCNFIPLGPLLLNINSLVFHPVSLQPPLPNIICRDLNRMAKLKKILSALVGTGRVEPRYWVNFQCRGVLLVWILVGQGPIALAVGAGWGLF